MGLKTFMLCNTDFSIIFFLHLLLNCIKYMIIIVLDNEDRTLTMATEVRVIEYL